MIGFYNYTVVLTYVGMVSGFLGITSIMNGHVKWALLFLIAAGICDMFDGKIASTRKRTKQEKSFGIQIDSLSDLICFGVLPALIVFHCSGGSILSTAISALYLLCALIRLAWFNVDEAERQENEGGCRKTYLGLPVTTSAITVPLVIAVGCMLSWASDYVYPLTLLVIGAAFLTPFRTKKPKLLGKLILIAIGAACLTLVLIGVPA